VQKIIHFHFLSKKKSSGLSTRQSESFVRLCISFSSYECHHNLYDVSCMVLFSTHNFQICKLHCFSGFLRLAHTFLRQFHELLLSYYKKSILAFKYTATFFTKKQVANGPSVTLCITGYLLCSSFAACLSIQLSCPHRLSFATCV
jgi:hypothetical protein